ncbi:MAG: hypothetical protein ACRECJ_02455 [Limisphaerales bacterium]
MRILFAIFLFSFLQLAAQTPSGPEAGPCLEIRYEGLLDYEAHYKKPGEIRRFHSRQVFAFDGRGNARLDWTIWSEGDTAGAPESFLLVANKVFHRWEPKSRWRELADAGTEPARLQVLSGLPWILSGDTVLRNLKFKTRKNRLESVEDRRAHPRLGDVRNSIRYSYSEDTIPAGFEMTIYRRDAKRTVQARLTGTSSAPESLLAAPIDFEPDPSEEAELTQEPVLVPRAEGVWSLDMEDIDHRSLVVEFADYLAVLEAAVGSANGERMVDAAKRRWPEKPIRYFSFSHFHPHYTGGMRAFIAEGATILTPPGNEEFVRQVARYSFKLSPDRLARSPRRVRIQTFRKRFELADSTNRLVAIDIGERSMHTDEFVIFYLPKQKLLFEAEQGWLTVDGKLRATRRTEGFLKVLADEGLDVERLVQCWPMEGNKAEVSRSELEALVAERKK